MAYIRAKNALGTGLFLRSGDYFADALDARLTDSLSFWYDADTLVVFEEYDFGALNFYALVDQVSGDLFSLETFWIEDRYNREMVFATDLGVLFDITDDFSHGTLFFNMFAGDDTIIGNKYGDVIFGGLGQDDLRGRGGNDRLFGQAGSDRMVGGGGNDRLNGGGDDDLLFGGAARDVIAGGPGNDLIVGGRGNDILRGNSGFDYFDFGRREGSDVIKDFNPDFDLIHFVGAGSFRDISFRRKGADVLLVYEDTKVLVEDITVSELRDHDNFDFA